MNSQYRNECKGNNHVNTLSEKRKARRWSHGHGICRAIDCRGHHEENHPCSKWRLNMQLKMSSQKMTKPEGVCFTDLGQRIFQH